jgi:signal transduction histidine kinase
VQTSVRDSLDSILQREGDDNNTRFGNAYYFLSASSAPADEIEMLCLGVLRPFVREAFKEDKKRLHIDLSITYLIVAFAHRERGSENHAERNEKELFYMEKALEEALLSEDNVQCAMCYNFSAYVEIKRGDVTRAHEYLYASLPWWDKAGMYVKSSEMLYTIASNFFEMKDADGLARVLGQMKEYLEKDNSKQSLYQYNAIKHHYFELLEEQSVKRDGRVDYAMVDSAMVYIGANVELVENSLPELARNWIHGYAYYFLARELDSWYPEQSSRIFDALDRARKITEIDLATEGSTIAAESSAMKEFEIMLNSIRAKALFRTGRLRESREVLDETLILLSGLEDHENLNSVRSIVYRFAVEYYDKTGNTAEALRFQALLTTNEARIHEKDKITAINEMSARYEAEMKQTRIETLTRENRTTRQLLWLIAGLSTALIAAALFIVLLGRARRKLRLTRRYIDGLESERARLSKELHDGVCNDLLAIEMRMGGNSELQQARENVRHLSHELMPPVFQYAGINEILGDYLGRQGVKYTVSADANWAAIPQKMAFELYRIVQEAVGNALKHAGAKTIEVSVDITPHRLKLIVKDDGRGMEHGTEPRLVKERVESIGGVLEIFTDERGTTLTARFTL